MSKNYAQYSDEAQNPNKYITESSVRKFEGWDVEDEDHVAEQFMRLQNKVWEVITRIVTSDTFLYTVGICIAFSWFYTLTLIVTMIKG